MGCGEGFATPHSTWTGGGRLGPGCGRCGPAGGQCRAGGCHAAGSHSAIPAAACHQCLLCLLPPQFFFLKYVDPATYQILGKTSPSVVVTLAGVGAVHPSVIHCVVSTHPGLLLHANRSPAPLPHVPQATSRL